MYSYHRCIGRLSGLGRFICWGMTPLVDKGSCNISIDLFGQESHRAVYVEYEIVT